jgi:hypothetical protein
MFGRPVHLLGAATIAAAASLFSASTASAYCNSCGPSVIYQAPVATYSAPMVYGYTYQAPMAYPAPVQYAPGCGCAAHSPMYVVNQGPAFNAPVVGEAEPILAYEPGDRRAYPYSAGGHVRWHHRHWNRGFGYRGYGMHGYEQRGFRYRGFGHRYGAVMPGMRYSMRHPMMGPGMNRMHGMHRPMMGGMHHPMMGGMHHPMMGPGMMHRGPRHAGGMRPGTVYPMSAPKQKMP